MTAQPQADVDLLAWTQPRFGLSPDRWAHLNGRSFWVTGAGTGYGRAISCALALAGSRVILTGRRRDKLLQTVDEAKRLGASLDGFTLASFDLSDADQIDAAVSAVRRLGTPVSGLVNNAALPSRPGSARPLLEDPCSYWDQMMATNVRAAWLLTRGMLPSLMASGAARVLLISSEAGWASTPGVGMYNVSKAALNSLAHSLAQEVAACYPQADCQINTVLPGQARTEMNAGSDVDPFALVPLVLRLLSHPAGGPTGRFFHRDGRQLGFGYTEPYPDPLI